MDRVTASVRQRPWTWTAVVTLLAYALVIGTFLDALPIYPTIDLETSTLLSHTIAAVNAATVGSLIIGWYLIRNRRIDAHRIAMVVAIGLIMVFLVLYLLRVGGGGTKRFVGPSAITLAYLLMLAVHILLSIVAVPLVVFAVLLGLTHTPVELAETRHAQVGRVAVVTWLLSLVLGLVTYVMLEHLYGWEYIV